MGRKYSGLYELIENDGEAGDYFDTLPEYVKESIQEREQNINSFESLRDYATNLMRNE
ncbi:MAG: hypothetical protein GX485_03635 [Clostridiales bacterium]|jgi:hypothetical protein|nr:hypothetical protein [Clostridiales bacterium]